MTTGRKSSSDENHLKSTRLAFDERWNESAPRSRILSSPYNVKTRPTRRGAHPDDAHTRVRPHARLCRRMPPPPRLAARRAPRPRLFTACYEKNASSVPSSRLADSLAGVGQETLNQGDLLTANLALTAQALLVARGHVGVQVLLPRAPVQNLFRARIGKKKRGEARRSAAGSGRKERGAPRESGRLLRATLLSVARAPPLAGWRTVPRSAFPSRRRFARMFSRETSDEQTLNPIRRWLIRARRERARARDASLGGGRRRTFPLAVILNRLAADLLVLALP
jgi:hypothetical protein